MSTFLMRAAAILATTFSALSASADPLLFDGRTWYTNDPDPGNPPTYSVVADSGVMTGTYGPEATMATPITIAVGDTVSYDYTLTNPGSNNWVGNAMGDFRGGAVVDDTNFSGYLISGRVGYQQDFAADRALWFQNSGFGNDPNSPYSGSTEDSPGIRVTWWFPTSNTYQVTVTNIGSGAHLLTGFHGSTGGNPVTDIGFFRQSLDDTLQTATISNFSHAPAGAAGSLIFGFEGGITVQGFKDLTAASSVTNWSSTSASIDIGDGFNLLSATQGSDRVVIEPYADRDNFGHANHRTLLLRSPTFELDGSGSLQVDMMGGMRDGENKSLAAAAETDPQHVGELGSKQRNADFDFGGAGEVDDGKHHQGFALRNALTGQYVLVGSSRATNDGKMRGSDPFARGVWDTALFTAEQLAPFANDGNRYEIDFFDSFGESSWGWIGFDNLRVPGALSPFQPGDTDGDDDTDDTDSAAVFDNFTGTRSDSPVAKTDGLARVHGDFDGNGDVDGGDVIEHVANIGLTAPTSGAAMLLYDPSDGSVVLDATGANGGVITTFRLLSDSAALATSVATLPISANSLATDMASELFWADADLNGFAGLHDLGSILTSGLTLAGVEQALSAAEYVGTAGTGAFDFNIVLALSGDFNHDGSVDTADYVVWRKSGGSQDEYNLWRANFGNSLGSGAGSGDSLDSGSVPEPSSLILGSVLLAVLLAKRVRTPRFTLLSE
jgi:hypothetical protein